MTGDRQAINLAIGRHVADLGSGRPVSFPVDVTNTAAACAYVAELADEFGADMRAVPVEMGRIVVLANGARPPAPAPAVETEVLPPVVATVELVAPATEVLPADPRAPWRPEPTVLRPREPWSPLYEPQAIRRGPEGVRPVAAATATRSGRSGGILGRWRR